MTAAAHRAWAAIRLAVAGGYRHSLRALRALLGAATGRARGFASKWRFLPIYPPPGWEPYKEGKIPAGSVVDRISPARKLLETQETIPMDPTPKPPPALPMIGAAAYRWAWLRHGALLPYVRAQTLDLYAAQLYPRGVEGWVNGRLTVRAGAYWAQRATTEELAQAEAQAIDEAPAHLIPATCPVCHGVTKDPARPCLPCFGAGLLHALQPKPTLRPLP